MTSKQRFQNMMGSLGSVSHEVIDAQFDSKLVKGLISSFEELKNYILDNGVSTNKQLSKSKQGEIILQRIEKLVKDEIGFKPDIKLLDNYGNACVYTVPPVNYNTLGGETNETYDALKEEIDAGNKDDLYNKVYKSFNAIEKTLNTSGVVIDRRNAKIKNLPDDYLVVTCYDFIFFIKEIKVTPEEMAAIFLHEMGHAFTYIEISYRSVVNTTAVLSAVSESVLKHNKSFKESLLIVYEKAYNGNINDVKDKGVTAVLIATLNEMYKTTTGYSLSNHANADSEQQADQFVARLGLGAELASGLQKFNLIYNLSDMESSDGIETVGYIGAFSFVVLMYELMLSGLMTLAGIGLAAFFSAGIAFLFLILIVITNKTYSGHVGEVQTYDFFRKRILRIRNDLVRQIRITNMDKELTKIVLDKYEQISKLINKLDDAPLTTIDKINMFFSKAIKDRFDAKKMEEGIENLMENSLYISSLKLKALGAK